MRFADSVRSAAFSQLRRGAVTRGEQRNLLYTAVTRAKQLVVLVGSRRALATAVRTAGRRHTALAHRLGS